MSVAPPARDEAAYRRAERWLELPMTFLALGLGVLLLVPETLDISEGTEDRLDQVGWLIWGLFAFEYLLLLWLAPRRLQMVKEHPLELILLMLPMLRALRALRFVRVFAGLGAALGTVRVLMARRGLQWFFVFVLALVGMGACLTLAVERQVPEAQITTIGEALWWAIVTCTTVGYGDFAPVTPIGRAVATILMLVGISVVSVVTANIASFFVEQEVEEDTDRLEAQLAEVNAKLDKLLDAGSAGS